MSEPTTVWTVQYSNYDPPEVDSIWATEADAQAEAARLNDKPESTRMWEVGSLLVRGPSEPFTQTVRAGLTLAIEAEAHADALDVEALTQALDDPERFGWSGPSTYAIAYAAAIRDVKAFLAERQP